MNYLPVITGQNLESEKATFPMDFTSRWNILLCGFLMDHQPIIDSWLPHVNRWREEFPSLSVYEIPVLPGFDFASRASIHLSLRWYISDLNRRNRTYPVFTDIGKFLRETNTPNQAQARIMLVDNRGRIEINAPGAARENLLELFERKLSQSEEEFWRPDL